MYKNIPNFINCMSPQYAAMIKWLPVVRDSIEKM